jgi:hypothetical protein
LKALLNKARINRLPSAYEPFPGMLPEPSKLGIFLIKEKKCTSWYLLSVVMREK